MKRFLTLILIFSILSCKQKETTKADLSFKLISMWSLYGAEPEQIEQFEKILDSINNNPNSNKQDRELHDFFLKLKSRGLTTSPYINLKIGTDSTMVVYLSEFEYKKVKGFDHNDLLKRNKKIELELEIEENNDGIYYTERILNVKEVDGKTTVKK